MIQWHAGPAACWMAGPAPACAALRTSDTSWPVNASSTVVCWQPPPKNSPDHLQIALQHTRFVMGLRGERGGIYGERRGAAAREGEEEGEKRRGEVGGGDASETLAGEVIQL